MPEFSYADLLPLGQDVTSYRRLTSDGVAARFHLRAEPISEEALDQRGEVGCLHRIFASTAAPVIRVEASSSSSGTASRYQ